MPGPCLGRGVADFGKERNFGEFGLRNGAAVAEAAGAGKAGSQVT